jgi:Raf kinase inhibitor-like YbhB/YbcL family protein
VHWVAFNIPAAVTGLEEGVPATESLSDGGQQGTNDFGRPGYGGPSPPGGSAHRYFFKLYALDTELDLEAGATKQEVLDAMEGHVLGQGQLVGTYQRN